MRILSLQPEIDPRAYKINHSLMEMFPDIELFTLFGDKCYFDRQLEMCPFMKNFIPKKYSFIFGSWGVPRESFIKYYFPISDSYARIIARRIKKFAKSNGIDIIHARPPPDFLGYVSRKYTSYPVVSEIYDMTSLTDRHIKSKPKSIREGFFKLRRNIVVDSMCKWESYIAQHSDYFVIPYPGIAEALSKKQKVAPTIFVPNAIPKQQIPSKKREKLSSKTGNLHLVHVGGIDIEPLERSRTRAIFPKLEKLSKMGFHVHLYAMATPEKSERLKKICGKSDTLHWHDLVPPPMLYEELTQYDAGLILVCGTPRHMRHIEITLPNRLFEYLSAGLFVISSSELKATNDFTRNGNWGMEVSDVEEIKERIAQIKPVEWDDRFCLEHYLADLRKAYDSLV